MSMRTAARLCLFTLAGLFALPISGVAQGPPQNMPAGPMGPMAGVPKIFGTFDPKPGVWAEYNIVDKMTGERSKMRMSILSKEGDLIWYEVVNQQPKSVNVIKMLVKGHPNDTENIQRLIIQSGDEKPVEMPRDFVMMGRKMATHMFTERSGVPQHAENVTSKDVGTKTVTVQAGTFTGMEKQILDDKGTVLSTYVFVESVPPFGIAVSDAEHTTMELTAYGKDAASRIKGEPVKMTSPPGMPEGMPRGMPPGMMMEHN
jgi:hypothetical protein